MPSQYDKDSDMDGDNDRDEMSGGGAPVTTHDISLNKKYKGGLASHLVTSLREELEASRLDWEVEKLKTLREDWEERKDRREEEKRKEQERLQGEEMALKLKQESEEKKAQERREKIQRAKEKAVPEILRKELPPEILALTYLQIEHELEKLNVIEIPEGELLAYALKARDEVWGDPSRSQEVKMASIRGSLKAIDDLLHKIYEECKKKFPELTFDDFMQSLCLQMLVENPRKTVEMFLAMKSLIDTWGSQGQKKFMQGKVGELLQSLAA
jgi:hypothetical protein